MFRQALDGALPVYVIGTALIFVFGSLLKTDEPIIRNALGPVRAIPNPPKVLFAREESLASNTVRLCSQMHFCRDLQRCFH